MEGDERQACGFLRFFKRDGAEGSTFPLETNEEYTIGYDNQASIRLKTAKSSLKPIQCVIKIDANGFAQLINKDIAHGIKLNNKALYGSKYLMPGDVFFVLEKKIRYENQDLNKNNLMKLSSRNKLNTPLRSSSSTKGRKSYTATVRKHSLLDGQTESVVGFKSLRGSKTPHVKKRSERFSTLSEKKTVSAKTRDHSFSPLNPPALNLKTPLPVIKIHEVQSPGSMQSKRTPSRRCSTNRNPVCFCMTSSSRSEETRAGFHVSPLATKLDDLNTPPNNKSVVEINLTPLPSVKKRKSQKFAVTDDVEDNKTPKTTSHLRNSLQLFSDRRSRKSSLSNALSSISENIGLTESPATKRVSSTPHSVITRRNATPKLSETYSPLVKEQETTVRKSRIKLNETYSEDDLSSGNDEQEASAVKLNETYSETSAKNDNDDSPSVTKQKQTPNTRKSKAELNADDRGQVLRPLARKSIRKLNKTFSDADFSSSVRERGQQQMYSPALVKRRLSNFVETTFTLDQKPSTPILTRNLQSSNTSTVKRPLRQSSFAENLNAPFFKVSPRSPISNVTFRRPLRNVTSTYHLSQENIMLVDSDLEHSESTPKGSMNLTTSQENQNSERVGLSDSISKGMPSPLERPFTNVFHSSPMIKARRTRSGSLGKMSFSPLAKQQLGNKSSKEDSQWLNSAEQNDHTTSKMYSLLEDESSEESSLVKQLTLVLSDEDLAKTKVDDEQDLKVNVADNPKSYSGPRKKPKRSSLLSAENSSLKSDNTRSPSLLETTRSSSFYYERPSSAFAQRSSTFSDWLNKSNGDVKSERRTPRTSKNDSAHDQSTDLLNKSNDVKSERRTPRTSKNDSAHDQSTDLLNKSNDVKSERRAPINSKNDSAHDQSTDLLNKSNDVKSERRRPRLSKNDSAQDQSAVVKSRTKTVMTNKSPKNDLSDVAGVKRLLRTPRERRQEVKNDLSDVRGVRKLMATPKPERSPLNDLTQVKGLKKLMRTPKPVKSPKNDLSKVAGVRRLMESPRERKEPRNDLSDVRGVRWLMSTPKEQRSPLNDITDVKGVKRLLRTPRVIRSPENDLRDVAGIRRLMEGPREQKEPENDLSDVRGIRRLISTPKEQQSPLNDITDVKGVKRLLRTPRVIGSPKNDLRDVAGIRRLMEGPREQKEPENDLSDVRGIRRLMSTPKEHRSPLNDLTDVRGVKRLLRTPRQPKSPANDLSDVRGVRDLMRSPKRSKSMDLSGAKDLMMTPVASLEASTSEMGDFDALLNKKPVRTYRGKSRSPFKSPKMDSESDDIHVQPDVAKWVEEQDNYYLQTPSEEAVEKVKAITTPNKEKSKISPDKIKLEVESADLSPPFRTTKRRQREKQIDVPEIKATRGTRKQQVAEEEEVTAKEIKSPRNRRLPKVKQEAEQNTVQEVTQENRTTRSRRVPKNKQQNKDVAVDEDDVQEMLPARTRKFLAAQEESAENDVAVEKTKRTRSRRLPKNKQQIEGETEDQAEANTTENEQQNGSEGIKVEMPEVEDELSSNNEGQVTKPNTRSRRRIKVEEAEPKMEVKATRSRRQPKIEEKPEEVPSRSRKHFKEETPEPADVAVEDAGPKLEVKSTRSRRQPKIEEKPEITNAKDDQISSKTRKHFKEGTPEPADVAENEKNTKKKETKTSRSKKQQKNKNEEEDDGEEKEPSPKLLRTRKRKADASEETDTPTEPALVKRTKKLVTFDVDSPRRSNRTPRKVQRIADEQFEFDVDHISVGHSKRATRKNTEKAVEEDAATSEEPRRSRRTRK